MAAAGKPSLPSPPSFAGTIYCGHDNNRVVVNVRSYAKHSFPVAGGCVWQHIDNVTPAEAGCRTVDGQRHGGKVNDHRGTAKCFDTNPCKAVGDGSELQMLILRDP